MLTTPPVKKIDLHFPLGLEVTARNMKGVTIKDALDAIYKQYRKKVSFYHIIWPSTFRSLVAVAIPFSIPTLLNILAKVCINRPMMNSRTQS